jgi:hypothetical protein
LPQQAVVLIGLIQQSGDNIRRQRRRTAFGRCNIDLPHHRREYGFVRDRDQVAYHVLKPAIEDRQQARGKSARQRSRRRKDIAFFHTTALGFGKPEEERVIRDTVPLAVFGLLGKDGVDQDVSLLGGNAVQEYAVGELFQTFSRDPVLAGVPRKLLAIGGAVDHPIEGFSQLDAALLGQAREGAVLIMSQIKLPACRDIDVVGDLLGEPLHRQSALT